MLISIDRLKQAKAWPDLIKAYQDANLEQFNWKDGFAFQVTSKSKFRYDYQTWLIEKFKLSGSFIKSENNYLEFQNGLLLERQYPTVGGICHIELEWEKYPETIKQPFNTAYYPFYIAKHIKKYSGKKSHSTVTIWNANGQCITLEGDIDMPEKIHKVKIF